MTPSERAARYAEELATTAKLFDDIASVMRTAERTGLVEMKPTVGPAALNQMSDRIKQVLFDTHQAPQTHVADPGERRCLECGNHLTGA